MIYNVKNIIGQFAVDQTSGTKLYEMIYAEIASGQSIELDFAEVRVYSATFFSHAIAQLLRDFSPDKLNKCLTINNLSVYGEEVLRQVIANAKNHYAQTP